MGWSQWSEGENTEAKNQKQKNFLLISEIKHFKGLHHNNIKGKNDYV